jgi:hypothetical protein
MRQVNSAKDESAFPGATPLALGLAQRDLKVRPTHSETRSDFAESPAAEVFGETGSEARAGRPGRDLQPSHRPGCAVVFSKTYVQLLRGWREERRCRPSLCRPVAAP